MTERSRGVADQVGVPTSAQNPENVHAKRNIPNALRGRNPPHGAAIVAGRSVWSSRILLMVVLAIGAALSYLG